MRGRRLQAATDEVARNENCAVGAVGQEKYKWNIFTVITWAAAIH